MLDRTWVGEANSCRTSVAPWSLEPEPVDDPFREAAAPGRRRQRRGHDREREDGDERARGDRERPVEGLQLDDPFDALADERVEEPGAQVFRVGPRDRGSGPSVSRRSRRRGSLPSRQRVGMATPRPHPPDVIVMTGGTPITPGGW